MSIRPQGELPRRVVVRVNDVVYRMSRSMLTVKINPFSYILKTLQNTFF